MFVVVPVVILTLLTVWAYWPLIFKREWGGMCGEWDDRANFWENDLVRKPLSLASLQRMTRETRVNVYEPCGWFLKGIVQMLFATSQEELLDVAAHAHRLASLAFHWACGILLFFLAYRLGKSKFGAFAAASVWVVHPIHAEVIGWMSAQPYTLAAFFSLLMVHSHLSRSLGGPLWYALAVLSKSVAVPIPAAILALDISYKRKNPIWKTPKLVFGYACVAVLAVAKTLSANRLGHDPEADVIRVVGLRKRLSKALVTIWFSLGNLVNPSRLRPHYALDSFYWTDTSEQLVAASFILAILLFALTVAIKQKKFHWLALWVYCAATFSPSCGIVQHGMIQKGGDRYAYLPSLGLAIALGGAVGLQQDPLVAAPALAVVLATQATLTSSQVQIWRNDDTLLTYSTHVDPHDWRVLDTYAELLMRRGQGQPLPMFEEALRAVERMRLPPNPKEMVFRGKIKVLLGDTETGCGLFRQAQADYPNSAFAHNNAAVCALRDPELRAEQGQNFARARALAYRDEHKTAIDHNLRTFSKWSENGFQGRVDATLVY